jgi:hypothetical protein
MKIATEVQTCDSTRLDSTRLDSTRLDSTVCLLSAMLRCRTYKPGKRARSMARFQLRRFTFWCWRWAGIFRTYMGGPCLIEDVDGGTTIGDACTVSLNVRSPNRHVALPQSLVITIMPPLPSALLTNIPGKMLPFCPCMH